MPHIYLSKKNMSMRNYDFYKFTQNHCTCKSCMRVLSYYTLWFFVFLEDSKALKQKTTNQYP